MNFLESLKEDLAELSNTQVMTTLNRSDLESLIQAWQQHPIRGSAHLYTTLKSGVNVLPSDVLKT